MKIREQSKNDWGELEINLPIGTHPFNIILFGNATGDTFLFGDCPTIELGILFIGGYTWLLRSIGLLLDYISSMEVILLDDTIVTTSPTKHFRLFEAIREFETLWYLEVVTKFKLKPLPLMNKVIILIDVNF